MLLHAQQLQQFSLVSCWEADTAYAAAVLRALAELPRLRSIGLPAELLCQQCCCDSGGAASVAAAAAAGGAATAATVAAAEFEGLYAALEALAVKPSVAVLAFLRFPWHRLSYSCCKHGVQHRQTLARLQQSVSSAAMAAAAAAAAAVPTVQEEKPAPSTGATKLAAAAAAGAGPAARGVARAQLLLLNCDECLCWADRDGGSAHAQGRLSWRGALANVLGGCLAPGLKVREW
jgi:hypothetical protein